MMDKTELDSGLINSHVVFVSQELPMQEAVQQMIDKGISSILVVDHDENVVGILTERDIVRKFTLLDMSDKLTRTVGTVMTRPVMFCRSKHLKKDITTLHLQHKIRHFPVLMGNEPKKENVVGIVSITDIARTLLTHSSAKRKVTEQGDKGDRVEIGILASQPGLVQMYRDLMRGLGFAPTDVGDIHKYVTKPEPERRVIIFDLDGFTDLKLHDLIPVLVKSKSFLIMTTSKPTLIAIFRKYMDHAHQEIAIKPLDLGYISWMITSKWAVGKLPESAEEEEEEEEI